MPRFPRFGALALLVSLCCLGLATGVRAQEAQPPAYLAVVDGVAMLERDGQSEPAVRDMPFVTGDRLRTENGRVEIEFPDGTAIEVAEDSIVDCVSPTRVRLIAGTMDHLPRRLPETQSMSGSYLPPDLQPYGTTFDRYGSWQNSSQYGYVWFPAVAPDWRPYYYGTWSAVPSYGWTWLGVDPWSYPTHHYGRWGYARNAWFWIPGRTWGTAWVSWGAAPDYVSWCPLGYDGRPVFSLSVGNGGWSGWTVMSRSHFGVRGYDAHRYGFDSRRFDRRTPFVQQPYAPVALPHNRGRQANEDRRGDERRGPNAERRTTNDGHRTPNDYGQAPSGVAVPRRAYPIEAPHAAEPPRTAEPPRQTTPGYAVPRDRRMTNDAPRTTTDAPRATNPDRRTTNDDGREPRRYTPREAAPRENGPRDSGPRESGARGSAPRETAPREAAPAPSRTPPPDATREGTARERGAGDGSPSRTRRPR